MCCFCSYDAFLLLFLRSVWKGGGGGRGDNYGYGPCSNLKKKKARSRRYKLIFTWPPRILSNFSLSPSIERRELPKWSEVLARTASEFSFSPYLQQASANLDAKQKEVQNYCAVFFPARSFGSGKNTLLTYLHLPWTSWNKTFQSPNNISLKMLLDRRRKSRISRACMAHTRAASSSNLNEPSGRTQEPW